MHWAHIKKEFRGKSAYSALLTKQINDVEKENGKVITIANSNTSYPILLKKGFKEESIIEMYEYNK